MTNVEKINEFLNEAKVFDFLTTDGDHPTGMEFLTHRDYRRADKFLRYDGTVKIVKDDALLQKVREAMPQIMAMYDKNGWEMGLFYLENGHAEIRGMLDLIEEFDV